MNVLFYGGSGILCGEKAIGAPDARAEWSKCCMEFGEMISQEVKTNPRYNDLET